MASDQYDTESKVESFKLFKTNAYVNKILVPTTNKMLGYNLKGKRVVDLACGFGDSTQALADLGPSELIGVDLSNEMIRRAEKECANDPKYSNIKFMVKNCLEPLQLGQFDLVFAGHLLNYAEKKEDLLKYYQVMYEATKEGGISAGVAINMFLAPHEFNVPQRYEKYGFRYFFRPDGVTLEVYFMKDGKDLFDIVIWIWPGEWHEECAKRAGFKRVEWIKPELEKSENEDGFWDDYINYPHFIYYKFYK